MYYAVKEVKGRAAKRGSQFSVYIGAESRAGCQGSATYGKETEPRRGESRRGGHRLSTSTRSLDTPFQRAKARASVTERERKCGTESHKKEKKRKQYPCPTRLNLNVWGMVLLEE